LADTSASLFDATLDINGSLTISGAALELRLQNASAGVSGDLRIENGMDNLIAFSLLDCFKQVNWF